MIVKYKHGDFMIEQEVDGYTGAFEFVSRVEEALHMEPCGLCDSTDIRRQARKHDKFTFYELLCRSCGAKLEFGTVNDDHSPIYPKRRDPDTKKPRPNRGWAKYERKDSNDSDDYTPIDDEPKQKAKSPVEWLVDVTDDATVKKLRAAAIKADVAVSALYDHLAEKFATDDEPPSSDELLMEATRWIKTR